MDFLPALSANYIAIAIARLYQVALFQEPYSYIPEWNHAINCHQILFMMTH